MRDVPGVFSVLATLALGLAAGAVLAEAAVLVPWWRSLPSEDFLAWYATNASRLFRFFGTLEALSAALVIVAAVIGRRRPFVVAAALSLAVLAVFPLYFERANASFESGSIASADVPGELARWAAWHSARTAMAVAAFAAALVGLRARTQP